MKQLGRPPTISFDTDIENIIKFYKEGASAQKIGKIYKCSGRTILRLLRKYKIEIRSCDCRKTILNNKFFNTIDTPEKAYWLGMLLTDGNVFGTRICLNLIDKEHLFKLAKSLGIENPNIRTHYKKQWPIYRLQFRNKEMVADLAKLGVVPRKSAICKPWKGPQELMSHFWRGCVDGDGCISKNKSGHFIFNFAGTKEMVNGFKVFIEKITGNIYTIHAKGSIFSININSIKETKTIASILYPDNSIALNRKFTLAKMAENAPDSYKIKRLLPQGPSLQEVIV